MIPLTEPLMREHQVALERLRGFEQALDRRDIDGVRRTLAFFDEQLSVHRRNEEEGLFPLLGRHIGTQVGPIACMLEEHRQERARLEAIRAALAAGEGPQAWEWILPAGRGVIEHLRRHIFKEDNVLFPLAEATLTREEMDRARTGMDAIGYCCPACGDPNR